MKLRSILARGSGVASLTTRSLRGAAAIEYMQLHAARTALNVFVHRSADSDIPPEKYPAIHRAALNACDALDGVKDGLIEDPAQCRFDPHVLECKSGDGPSCLTPAQVETARGMYAPIKEPSAGSVVSPALLQPGSELGWAGLRALNRCEMPWNRSSWNRSSIVAASC